MNTPAQQGTQIAKLSPVESYMLEVLDGRRGASIQRGLPAHIRPDLFERNFANLLMQKPEIMKHPPSLVFREVAKAAALGLLLDPQLGEAYIVPVWNGSTRREEPQLRAGYRGLIKLARQSGEIADIYPNDVRENDEWAETQGTKRELLHHIDRRKPRGEAFAYYAVVTYKNGTTDFEVMSMDELDAIREKSDGWRAYQAGRAKSTPWATDDGQMRKKTVLRRLLNRVPQSPDLSQALGMENASDYAPFVQRLLPNQPLKRLDAVRAAPPANQNVSAVDITPAPELSTAEQFHQRPADEPAEDASASLPTISNEDADAPLAEAASWEAPEPEEDPIARARQAGWNAADATVEIGDMPSEFADDAQLANAWKDGHQRWHAQKTEVEQNFDAYKQQSLRRHRRSTRLDE